MLKGINQWCFPAEMPVEQVMEQSGRAGFEAVELNVQAPGASGLTTESGAEDAKRMKALAERHGLLLRSLSCGLYWTYPFSSNDPDLQKRAADILSVQLKLAAAAGADTVLVVPGVVTSEVSYSDCYGRSQEELAKLLPLAEDLGVTIGIENVWNKFLLSPLEMARYVDELQSERARVYFDVGNVLASGYPEQWVRILGKRIAKVHVKDYRVSAGTAAGFVPLLSGDVDWSAVTESLRDIGYDDALTAELGLYRHNPLQVAFDASRQLDVILGRQAAYGRGEESC